MIEAIAAYRWYTILLEYFTVATLAQSIYFLNCASRFLISSIFSQLLQIYHLATPRTSHVTWQVRHIPSSHPTALSINISHSRRSSTASVVPPSSFKVSCGSPMLAPGHQPRNFFVLVHYNQQSVAGRLDRSTTTLRDRLRLELVVGESGRSW